MGRIRKSTPYLTSEQIYEDWKDWKSTGKVSEDFAQKMLLIAQHMTTMPQFNGYRPEDKEEMVQEACIKIIKNLHNMKEEKKGSFFSYWTMIVYTAFITYLRKHYAYINKKRHMLLTAVEYAQSKPSTTMLVQDLLRQIHELEGDVK